MTLHRRQSLLHSKLHPASRGHQKTGHQLPASRSHQKSQLSIPYLILLAVMPAVIECYLVPYTLGGTTIMIDRSELPAMPTPLLQHVMSGLDKRLKEPGVSSMVHTIKPVQLPPPEPNYIGVNNYKFRAGLPHLAESHDDKWGQPHNDKWGQPHDGFVVRPGLSNDFYTTDDGLVHFDILNQDVSGNAIDQEVSNRVQPTDDVNSYNKLNIMTSESPPDLNPLTVKPNIRDSSGQEHVNREYSGVSVKHLIESHLNPAIKNGMSGMHVNPEPIYEKKVIPQDRDTYAQNFNHDSRENVEKITASLEESGQDNEQYSQTFSFPGSEQLLYEKKISDIDSIQKRFAGQPPGTDLEDDLLSGEHDWSSFSADKREDAAIQTNTSNIQLSLPSTIVEKINELNGPKDLGIRSGVQGEKSTSAEKSDSEIPSPENVGAFEASKLRPTATESASQTAGASEFTDDAFTHTERIHSDSFEEKRKTMISLNVVEARDAPEDANSAESAVAFRSAVLISPLGEHSVAPSTGTLQESAEGLLKNARRSESNRHRMAVEALEQMRLENNLQMIMNSLRDDPEQVPAQHISEILSPGTMSYSHFTNPTRKSGETGTNVPNYHITELVKNANLGNLTPDMNTDNHKLKANVTGKVKENLHGGASSLIDSSGTPENQQEMLQDGAAEIPATIGRPEAALGNLSGVVDNRTNLEQEMPGDSGAANGASGSTTAAEDNHAFLVNLGGSLHSVTDGIFRKDLCHCGIRLSHKIIGGSVATISEFPWMVGFALKAKKFTFCGGTLITDRHILTAAHCVFRYQDVPSLLYVKAGSNDRENSPLSLNIKAIRVHPKYSEFNTAFDIAVVALEEPVEFSPSLLPVCLPTDAEPADVYKNGVVVGWGKTEPQGTVSTQLQKATVDLMTPTECRRQSNYDSSQINNKIICASAPGKDSCQGDSGGPLLVSNNHIIEAIGIVSWGIGCAEEQHPGVYTKIYSYRTWIKGMTRSGTKCKADPIFRTAKPEKIFDFRKEHNIFGSHSDDGELYPALRPAQRFRNKFLLQFEEPESFVFRSPILDDKIEGFDYVSENAEPIRSTESGMRIGQHSMLQEHAFDRSPNDHYHKDPAIAASEPINEGETLAGGKRETFITSDVFENFHPAANNRHRPTIDRAVLSQAFQSTVPISYQEGEDLADVFKLVNEELTTNDERFNQYETDDGISLAIGDRVVSSHTNGKHKDPSFEAATSHLIDALKHGDQFDSNTFVTEPSEQNTSASEDPLQNLSIAEPAEKKPEQESSSGHNPGDTLETNQQIGSISHESLIQEGTANSSLVENASVAGNRQTAVKISSIETPLKESFDANEFVEQAVTETSVGQGVYPEEEASAMTTQTTAKEEFLAAEAVTEQHVKTDSSADQQPNLQQMINGRPNLEISFDEQSNLQTSSDDEPNPIKKADEQSNLRTSSEIEFSSLKKAEEQSNLQTSADEEPRPLNKPDEQSNLSIIRDEVPSTAKNAEGQSSFAVPLTDEKPSPGKNANEESNFATTHVEKQELPILHDGLSNPIKLITEQLKDETKQEPSLTSATDVDKEQSFYPKPLTMIGFASSATNEDSLQDNKPSQNPTYQSILDRIRIATENRKTASLQYSSSSLTQLPNNDDKFSPEVNIVSQTDSPTSKKPNGTETSLITISDVLGQNVLPVSTSAPLDIEAIEALIHNLGQNERKLDVGNFDDTLEIYKRDTDEENHNENETSSAKLGALVGTFDNSNVRNANENSRTEEQELQTQESNNTSDDLEATIVELQDELIHSISKTQAEKVMASNATDDHSKGTNNTFSLGQHVIQISKPNFLNLSTDFDTTTSKPTSENLQPPTIRGQSDTEEIVGLPEINEDPDVMVPTGNEDPDVMVPAINKDPDAMVSKESGKPNTSTSPGDNPNESTNSILIEAHSIEIGSKNGFITLKNFTIGRPGYNFSLTFDDIDNRTASVLGGEQPIKNLEKDEFITLHNFTIGRPGFNFTLDFDDIDQNVTAFKNITNNNEGLVEDAEDNSSVSKNVPETPEVRPDEVSVRDETRQIEKLHERQKGDKLTPNSTVKVLKSGSNDDLLVRYVIRNSEDKTTLQMRPSTIDTESEASDTSTPPVTAADDSRGDFGELEFTTETKTSVATEVLHTGSEPAVETENVTELAPGNGNLSTMGTTQENPTPATDNEVQSSSQNTSEGIEMSTELAEDTTDVSATELPTPSSTHRTLEELERLRVIQRRIAKIQEEEKPEEDYSFLGMLQRHIFPGTSSRRRINDKVRAYRKPEDDLNEALSKIFSHYDYYDESDTSWG